MTTTLLVNIALSTLAFVVIVGVLAAIVVAQSRDLRSLSLTPFRRRVRVARVRSDAHNSRLAVDA
jgi:hypothetical protein